MSGKIEFYHMIGIVCLEAAIVLFVLSLFLFFKFHIVGTILYLSGSKKKKAIEHSMHSSFIPPKAPYVPKEQPVISVSELMKQASLEKQEENENENFRSEFKWGEELISATQEEQLTNKKKTETIWYFAQGEWKSKEIESDDVSENEDMLDDGSGATTKLDEDALQDGSGVTTKLDEDALDDGSGVTTKLDEDALDDGSGVTTKLDEDALDDGSGVTTKLDEDALDDGSGVTTKLDIEEMEFY